ncbi:MAG: DUF5693 family protein [Capsulimonadaceae bacterium]|nr:DUF5693 family protein [Capsulimonadaceae bacterium]
MDKNKLLIGLIVVGVLAALIPAVNRTRQEARNRRVETAVDYADAFNLAIASRVPFRSALAALKDAGITSLAITEDPIDSLRTMGAMTVNGVSPTETDLTFSPRFPGQMERVKSSLANKTSIPIRVKDDTIIVNAPYIQISALGAGLDPVQIQNTIDAGMTICPRLYNLPGASYKSIAWMLARVRSQCQRTLPSGSVKDYANVVIFAGPDVLGNRDHIDDTAQAMADTGLRYGSIEFGKQIGDEDLSRSALDLMVRVHSIASNEMPTMDEPTAAGRFVLGARERNIRLLYVRLFQNGLEPDTFKHSIDPNALSQPLEANVQFIRQVRQGLKEGGLRIGPAHGFKEDPLPSRGILRRLLLALIGIGAAAAGVLLVRKFTGIDGRWFWTLFAFAILVAIACAIPQHTMKGRQLMALVAAIALPSLGLMTLRLPRPGQSAASTFAALDLAFRRYIVASLWTAAGIVLLIGLLADRSFMLHIDEFLGIRLAIIMPMFLTLFYHGLGLADVADDAPWSERAAVAAQHWQSFTLSPLMMGQTIGGLIALAVVAVVVLRSGNEPGVGVSGTELSFRSLLNKLLFVRPRTKEFLFGHPLLIAGLASAFAGNRKWLTLYLAAGAIGQASMLNTFCHIHTPLLFSFVRAILGWIIGAGIGSLLFALLHRWFANKTQPA